MSFCMSLNIKYQILFNGTFPSQRKPRNTKAAANYTEIGHFLGVFCVLDLYMKHFEKYRSLGLYLQKK